MLFVVRAAANSRVPSRAMSPPSLHRAINPFCSSSQAPPYLRYCAGNMLNLWIVAHETKEKAKDGQMFGANSRAIKVNLKITPVQKIHLRYRKLTGDLSGSSPSKLCTP